MLSSLFESRHHRKQSQANSSPFASSYERTTSPEQNRRIYFNRRRGAHYQNDALSKDSSSGSEGAETGLRDRIDEDIPEEESEDEATPLLPIFDASHLDALPIYTLTLTIRLMVSSRCDTVLSWEQLLSPQVSQFLVKPIQQEIQANHFSAATIYCLMANSLQFKKEVDLMPGNSGTVHTRAMICELLAIKLLKEYTTRSLIDALSYDFDPLQGQLGVNVHQSSDFRMSRQLSMRKSQAQSTRITCLEIAIRAQAKRFLAHPMVVQQLEAIWNGSIVFHAAADNMHRRRDTPSHNSYGATTSSNTHSTNTNTNNFASGGSRRVVTLYNPRDASLFKLSRLRVPRYRSILSTISFAILLVLFVGVLIQRSIDITPLEVVFWFWAAGYMMDELVGFTAQGFGLYLASFWNTIDLGIVLILLAHFFLRIYGIMMPDTKKMETTNMAYELLGADAILLFPRIFSVLDHYRKFSQLIIAFRWMAADAAAVFILITIACSGFFVALSLSFGYTGTNSAAEAAYVLLQMVMGYTAGAWDRWATYTVLGRFVLVLALVLTQFLILTILITVMTNSFTAVVKNANEEHQFLFAVNTISSVKSHALFAYVAPLNVLQWILLPLQYILPFRQYVKLNRVVIKVTHFPILFPIYVYEKTILQANVVDRTDVIDQRKGGRSIIAQHLPRIVRPPSIANNRQDQALEEVFKQPIDAAIQNEFLNQRKESTTVVNKWMHDMVDDVIPPPPEEDPTALKDMERRRISDRRLSSFSRLRASSLRAISVSSDPGERVSHEHTPHHLLRSVLKPNANPLNVELAVLDEAADGDDELAIEDQDDTAHEVEILKFTEPVGYQTNRTTPLTRSPRIGSIGSGSRGSKNRFFSSNSGINSPSGMVMHKKPRTQLRNVASATGMYSRALDIDSEGEVNEKGHTATGTQPRSMTSISKRTSSGPGVKSPKQNHSSRSRPFFPSQSDPNFRSVPDLQRMLHPAIASKQRRQAFEVDIVSDIGDNKAIGGGYVGAIPASFATQMVYANDGIEKIQQESKEETEMFGRLVMARMNTLEEGFREVIHEMRENRKSAPGSNNRSPERPIQARRERRSVPKVSKSRARHKASDESSSTDEPRHSPAHSSIFMSEEEDRGKTTHASGSRRIEK